ncbi:MAG TPA: hypothetical protein VK988_05535 [Acidimicrobiales bacterium]|nr:hypothetical protein [Acidimicrobiales bacterium]
MLGASRQYLSGLLDDGVIASDTFPVEHPPAPAPRSFLAFPDKARRPAGGCQG